MFKVREFVMANPRALYERPGKHAALAGARITADRVQEMHYVRTMPRTMSMVTLHLNDSRHHELVVTGEELVRGPIAAGTVALLPSGKGVESWVKDRFDLLLLFIPNHFMEAMTQRLEVLADLDAGAPRPICRQDRALLHLGHAIIGAMEVEEPALREVQFEAMAEAFLTRLLVQHVARPRRRVRGGLRPCDLRQALALMEEGGADQFRVEDIAAQLGLSAFHFCRAFKESTGMPPLRFIQQRRLARAREMLSQRTLSVSDVSAEVGYRDPSHFAALFRREFGVSPGEFRRSLQASPETGA